MLRPSSACDSSTYRAGTPPLMESRCPSSVAGVMLELRVPTGRHLVELRYWPNTFTTGIVLAVCGVFGLAVVLILSRFDAEFARPKSRSG